MFKKIRSESMSSAMQTFDTMIGAGCKVLGDVNVQVSIRIDGIIDGNVSAKGKISIGESGKINGNISCEELIVFGWINGQLDAQQIQLKKSAVIQGEIRAKTLSIEPGAIYQGNVMMQVNEQEAILESEQLINKQQQTLKTNHEKIDKESELK